MTFNLNNSPMVKADPSLAEPWPKISPEQRESVRKRLVASFSSSPLYQQAAKESGDEAKYWSNFTVGGIVLPRKQKTPPGDK